MNTRPRGPFVHLVTAGPWGSTVGPWGPWCSNVFVFYGSFAYFGVSIFLVVGVPVLPTEIYAAPRTLSQRGTCPFPKMQNASAHIVCAPALVSHLKRPVGAPPGSYTKKYTEEKIQLSRSSINIRQTQGMKVSTTSKNGKAVAKSRRAVNEGEGKQRHTQMFTFKSLSTKEEGEEERPGRASEVVARAFVIRPTSQQPLKVQRT